MHKISVVLVVSLFAVGCAKRVPLYRSSPVEISTTGDGTCVERLLAKSRFSGYVEDGVDKDMGFFRVRAKVPQPLTVEGRKAYTVTGEGKRAKKKFYAAVPSGKTFAIVRDYNVQCTGPETALVAPINEGGMLEPDRDLMDAAQRVELDRYAGKIATTPPVAPAPLGAGVDE